MTMTTPVELTTAQCEEIFNAALAAGDVRGVEAALTLLAVRDPHRAQVLLDSVRLALSVARAGGLPATQDAGDYTSEEVQA